MNSKRQLRQVSTIVDADQDQDEMQALYERRRVAVEAQAQRVQSAIRTLAMSSAITVGSVIVLIAFLVGVLGNLHQYLETANAAMKFLLQWFVPGMIGAGVIWCLIRLYRALKTWRFDSIELKRNQAEVDAMHADTNVRNAEADAIRDEQWRRNRMVEADYAVRMAEAAKILRSIEFDENGNAAVVDPNTLQINMVQGNYQYVNNLSLSHRNDIADPKAKVSEEKPLALPAPIEIPEKYDLLDVFRTMDIGPDSIFIGKTDQRETLTVRDNELCHGVFNAITGRGKTIVERGLESQLLHVGHIVVHCDLKFAPVTDNGLDYRPIARKLWMQDPLKVTLGGQTYDVPCLVREESDIAAVLRWLAYDEMQRRLVMRDNGDFSYPTLYCFLEEMLAFVSQYPEAAEDVVRIIALGRELRIKLFTAAQNFLGKDTKLTGGAKENFETAYFLGGDEFSGAKVLDVGLKDLRTYLMQHNIVLGKSLGMVRNNTVAPQARLTRIGMASNEAIYYHHGRADNFVLPPRRAYIPPELSSPKKGTQAKGRGTNFTSYPSPQSQMSQDVSTMTIEGSVLSGTGPRTGPLQTPTNPLVAPAGRAGLNGPNLGPEDREMNAAQVDEFERLYLKGVAIKECLRLIDGCNNRHYTHARWVIQTRRLDEKRQAQTKRGR